MATEERAERGVIEAGPSRETLFDSLRLYEIGIQIGIRFKTEQMELRQVRMIVTSIGRAPEDNCWLVTGNLTVWYRDFRYAKFQFNASTREGFIDFHDKDPLIIVHTGDYPGLTRPGEVPPGGGF